MTFKSCDNVLFKVHHNNIMTHSEGFAPPDGTLLSEGEIVPLPESADVLELLFQYIYPRRTPDLKKVRLNVLVGLAEAVEKYQVYSAMDICHICMECVKFLTKVWETTHSCLSETSSHTIPFKY